MLRDNHGKDPPILWQFQEDLGLDSPQHQFFCFFYLIFHYSGLLSWNNRPWGPCFHDQTWFNMLKTSVLLQQFRRNNKQVRLSQVTKRPVCIGRVLAKVAEFGRDLKSQLSFTSLEYVHFATWKAISEKHLFP